MLPKKTRHIYYAVLLLALSAVCTSAVANSRIFDFISEVASVLDRPNNASIAGDMDATSKEFESKAIAAKKETDFFKPVFATIIQGADQLVGCANDGSTLARFNLCGDSDNRIVTLSGSYSSVSWQILGGSCSPVINNDCPNTTLSCYSQVATGSSFTINAASIPSAIGAEFRVVADGQQYFFKVKKSNITQTFVKNDFICGVPGRIQITNLSSAYEFSINSGSGFGPWQGPIFNNLNPGTYVVKARLQNTPDACEYPYAPIVIQQRDIDIDVTFTDAQCAGDTGTITVTANNVPGPYKYTLLDASGTAQEFTAFIPNNPYTFAAVGFGTYTVQVETQQCTGDPLNGILPPRQNVDTSGNPIVIGNGVVALSASAEPNNSFSAACGINSVDITVYTSGGTPPYTYIVNGAGPSSPPYGASRVHTINSPGTYEFTITDANGCTIMASANVEELTPPDITVSGVNGTCTNGGARLQFNIIDAKGYDLSFRADPGDPWSTNPVLSVSAGTYNNIEVLYESGAFNCILSMPNTVTVTEVGAINGTAVKIADRTCIVGGGVNGGVIDIQGVSGGSGSGYQYSIDGVNFSPSPNFTGLAAGTYVPAIIDDSGCRRDLTPITINNVDPPTDIAFAQSNINCSAGTSDVQLTVTANAAIATFEIIAPIIVNNGGSNNFIGLPTNVSYQFRATDVNGCSITESFTPSQISSIRARVKSGGDLRVCTGASDGTGTFIIDGFANNYTYDINGGLYTGGPQNNAEVVLPPSGAGTYTITVTDADTGCTDSIGFTISEPATPIALTGNVTAMSCANGNIGRVIASASGGWGGYQYTLVYPGGVTTVGPKTGATFNNLSLPGAYTLSVADAEGCTTTFGFTLTPINAPNISIDTALSDYCYIPGTGATIAVTSTAGTAALATHQYRINGGSLQASPIFAGLNPGNYTIEVVDGNNCRDQIGVTINPQLRVNTGLDTAIPCGGAPGQIQVTVTGGYLANAVPKEYQVSGDNGVSYGALQPLVANSFLYPVTAGGTYIFRVTDNQGCEAYSSPLVVDPPQQIAPATVTTTPVSCGNPNNGTVTITPDATSGIPPYEVSFNGGPFTAQTVYSNLAVGNYPFIVRDSRGCETPAASAVILLDATPGPDATVSEIQATCSAGAVSGGITINSVSNGTPNFTFIIEDYLGNQLFTFNNVVPASLPLVINDPLLIPGNYTVVTLDANGCRDVDPLTITQNTVDVVPDPVPLPLCSATGFSNTVEIFGGIGPFLIRLENDPLPPVAPNSPPRRHTFNGLQYGVAYTVEVTDTATGCIYLDLIPPITGPSTLDVTATSTAGFCDVNRNGEIIYTVTGFAPGDNLQIELLDNSDGSRIILETVAPASDPYTNNYLALPGDYQIIVTNLTDDCTDATGVIIDQNLPTIDILAEEPANCNAAGQITVQGAGGAGGPYEFAYMPTGSTPNPGDWTLATTFVAAAGSYDVFVRDISGCTSFAIATVIQLQPDLLPPTITVDNQCVVTATQFDVTVSMDASTVDTPRFTLAGDTQFGVLNIGNNRYEYTFQVSSPGVYVVDVTDAYGCTSQGTAEVYEFLSASGDFTASPSCNNADGVITVSVIGGSNQFSYQLQDGGGANIGAPILGDRTDGIFNGMAPGTFQVEVTDTETLCDFVVDVELLPAVPPIIDNELKQDISCFGSDDGSIDILLRFGTDVDVPIEFILNNLSSGLEQDRNFTGSFAGLPPAQYQVEVLSARGCSVLSGVIDIIEPSDFAITASAPDFTCEPGANRFSSTIVTVNVDPGNPGTVGSGYQYSITGFSNYQLGNTFEIVDNGSPQNITVYAIDGNGCQTTFVLPTINPPTDVVPTLTVVSPLNCRDPEAVEINVIGTTDFTVITSGPLGTVVPDVSVSGVSVATVFLPDAGDYMIIVRDDSPNGCDYPLPIHTVIVPIDPTALVTEAKPITCFGDSNGELFIDVGSYTGNYNYTVYRSSDVTKTTPMATGSFDTANFPDIFGDLARITGLPAGNFFVEVVEAGSPYCTVDSNVVTVRSPNGALDVQAVEVGNVSCDDNAGTIDATGSGGWDTSPYEYQLLKDDGSGTYLVEVGYSANNLFQNLTSGDYRVEIRDVEGCTDTFDITLSAIPAIQAGIREPQNLVCPGGNNAVLEAYDPISGNPGAIGGVAGAGYKYQLIYLNSNNIADERDRSGLQDSPTFIGAFGGVISAGWYAIEITSSYNCSFVTPPYEVVPPPPVEPKLVQTQVPGCGGMGEMRLYIENPDPLFTYEYRIVPTPDPINDPYTDLVGNTVLIPGIAGVLYQFDVRKKNASNTCNPVRSNGINMTDATGVTLLPNQPDDISCASELDGRIESFINGGVGNDMFTLYIGDPVDAFAPVVPAFRGPQNFGTFEGLPEGNQYYIAVTSGVTCQDIAGPFEIIRPAPIVFTADSMPVSCNGENDGTITIEVMSGGVGLIQFAIEPNFNEFFSEPTTPGIYTFDDLAAGNYEILIQDENGCFEKDVITVTEPMPLQTTNIQVVPELCIGANDGTMVFEVIGGTPFVDPMVSPVPYFEYKVEMISPIDQTGTGVFAPYNGQPIQNLQGGASYALYVQDANLCNFSDVFNVGIGVDLTAEPLVQYGCEGIFPNSTATVQMQDASLLPQMLFYLEDLDSTDPPLTISEMILLAEPENTFGDLPAGQYRVHLFHSNGCSNTTEFTIDPYGPLTLTAEKTGPNELTAMASGGYGGYEYFFQGQSQGTDNVYLTNVSGNVEVRVVDRNGCVAVVMIPFEFTGMLELPNFFTPDGNGENDLWMITGRDFFPYIEIKIYDRYGRVVAILDQVTNWDGTYEGKELPSGDYWYVVNQNDARNTRFVGHFTLYR